MIRRSAEELRQLADQHGLESVVVPRPGCGGGGMRWQEVRPMLEELFDDRFIVVGAPECKMIKKAAQVSYSRISLTKTVITTNFKKR
jgi:hypothetical protein